MRAFVPLLLLAATTFALPGCFATVRGAKPLGVADGMDSPPYSLEIIVGINAEIANTIRFGGGGSQMGMAGAYTEGGKKGTLTIAPTSTAYQADLTLKNWYRAPENEVCDYSRGFRARAGGFFASVTPPGEIKDPKQGGR